MSQSNPTFQKSEQEAALPGVDQARQEPASKPEKRLTKDGRERAKFKRKGETIRERFMSRFEKLEGDSCWNWKAGRFSSGYGAL